MSVCKNSKNLSIPNTTHSLIRGARILESRTTFIHKKRIRSFLWTISQRFIFYDMKKNKNKIKRKDQDPMSQNKQDHSAIHPTRAQIILNAHPLQEFF